MHLVSFYIVSHMVEETGVLLKNAKTWRLPQLPNVFRMVVEDVVQLKIVKTGRGVVAIDAECTAEGQDVLQKVVQSHQWNLRIIVRNMEGGGDVQIALIGQIVAPLAATNTMDIVRLVLSAFFQMILEAK